MSDSTPVEDATAVQTMNPVYKSAKCSEPGSRHEEVEWVVEKIAREWQHPDQGEKYADTCNDDGVDLPAFRTDAILVVLMEEVCHDA